jgi:predicted TIM-barrel fold metal-dependent hydrolase
MSTWLPHSLPLIDAIAARHSDLLLVIDHLGLMRPTVDHETFAHLPELLALAKRPNIAVKASALTDYSGEPYPHPVLRPAAGGGRERRSACLVCLILEGRDGV